LHDSLKTPANPLLCQAEEALSSGCRRTLAKIRRLAELRGYCFARTSTIARFFGVWDRTIRRHIATLIRWGFLRRDKRGLTPFLPPECPPNVREMSAPYKECVTIDLGNTERTTTSISKLAPARDVTSISSSLLITKTGMTPSSAARFADRDPEEVARWISIALKKADNPDAYLVRVLSEGFKLPQRRRSAALKEHEEWVATIAHDPRPESAEQRAAIVAEARRNLPPAMRRKLESAL
jgi:hypothetical protein